MFPTAIYHFVSNVGKDTLIGIDNLVNSDDIIPISVVTKKNRRWFWQSPKYTTTEFHLKDIIIDEKNILDNIEVVDHRLLNYIRTQKVQIKGELGAKIIDDLAHLSLKTNDTIVIEHKLGDIQKKEVNLNALSELLSQSRINFHHPLVKQVKQDKRKVLCVLTEVVYIVNQGVLHSKVESSKGLGLAATATIAGSSSLNISGEKDKEDDKAFKIPAGTPLAYSVCELLISKTGHIELVVVDGVQGGFGAYDDYGRRKSSIRKIALNMPVDQMFAGFMSLPQEEREKLRNIMRNIMINSSVIKPIYRQIKNAYRVIDGTVARSTTVDDLRNDISDDSSDWKPALSLAGFSFTMSGGVLYPTQKTAILQAFKFLFESLLSLSDEVVRDLEHINSQSGTSLLALLRHSVFSSKPIDMDRPGLSICLSLGDLLKNLNFSLDNSVATPPPRHSDMLQATYRVIYALFGN